MKFNKNKKSNIYIVRGLDSNSIGKRKCKDQIWNPTQDEWIQAQKAQNNEFVESGL